MKSEKLSAIFWSFFKMGGVLFGGGYAMLPLLEREVVERRKWCTSSDMCDIFALAQLIPGVIAINASMLVGHRLRGAWGTCVATVGVISVPFIVILAYAIAFDHFKDAEWMMQATSGLRPAVAGMMLGVAYTLFKRTFETRMGLFVSLLVFVLGTGFNVKAVHLILGGILVGLVGHGWRIRPFTKS